LCLFLADTRAARLRAIFQPPSHLQQALFADVSDPHRELPEALAVVEWYIPWSASRRDADSGLYRLTRSVGTQGGSDIGIVDVIDLRRSCHLLPDFGSTPIDTKLTSADTLDAFSAFFLNDCVDKHAYRTM
jgi:hypothetical protein